MQEKTFNQKELERLRFILKRIEEEGLEFYKYNEGLVLEYVVKGIKKEIEEYEIKKT